MSQAANKISVFQMIYAGFYILIFPFLILFLSGDWLWPEGWVWDIWYITLCVVTVIYLYRKDPALLTERFKRPGGNQKTWDKFVLGAIAIGFIGWIALMPLDAKRCGCSGDFPLGLKVLGGLGLIPSFFFIVRAYTDNTFLSPLVRLQKERKQKVVTTGVYAIVRHPMYLGALLMFIATPLLLGSWYAALMAVPIIAVGVIRTLGEEKMLMKELKGYTAYQKKVRYRLIPGVW